MLFRSASARCAARFASRSEAALPRLALGIVHHLRVHRACFASAANESDDDFKPVLKSPPSQQELLDKATETITQVI